MLTKRIIKWMNNNNNKGGLLCIAHKNLDIRDKHPILMKIEGWYNTDSIISSFKYKKKLELYEDANTKVKPTRWLLRAGLITEQEASELGQTLDNKLSFKISCRHNDLLRLSDTPHFHSCFAIHSTLNKGLQQLHFLADPDIAVIYVPDKAGKFQWRALIRLCINEQNNYCIIIYKSYGNSNEQDIQNKLNQILPLYIENRMGEKLISATRINNNIITQNIWSDHYCKRQKNNLVMYGIKYTRK